MSEREICLDEDGRTSDWDRFGAVMNAIDAAGERGEVTWLTSRGNRIAAIVPAAFVTLAAAQAAEVGRRLRACWPGSAPKVR